MKLLGEILAFNSGLGCTPQEGYRDLNHALSDTRHLSIEKERPAIEKQARWEVLAAVLENLRLIVYSPNWTPEQFFQAVEAYVRTVQPAASDLEAYVKNLPLSEIARIKGLPGIAKLGKTYDRPDFTGVEDE